MRRYWINFFSSAAKNSKFQDFILQIHWLIIFLILPLQVHWNFRTIQVFLSLEMLLIILVEILLACHEYQLLRLLNKTKD